MRVYVASTGLTAEYRADGWEYGIVHADVVKIDGIQILSSQGAAISAPSGGSVIDSAARTAIGQILSALRHHGLIAT